MNKQLMAVIIGAVVLFAVALVGTLAFTGGDSGAGNVHTMPGGQTMTGSMDTMSSGEQMPGMTHTSP